VPLKGGAGGACDGVTSRLSCRCPWPIDLVGEAGREDGSELTEWIPLGCTILVLLLILICLVACVLSGQGAAIMRRILVLLGGAGT